MIGIDLLADAHKTRGVHTHVRADAAERLGESDRRSPVQQSERLTSAVVDGHRASNEIPADFGEHDAERSHQRAGAGGVERLERKGTAPDAHGVSLPLPLSFAATRRYASRNGMLSFVTSALASAAA